MLAAIDALVEQGATDSTCQALASSVLKTDGLTPPPDFVQGPGAADLAAAMQQTQSDVGCY